MEGGFNYEFFWKTTSGEQTNKLYPIIINVRKLSVVSPPLRHLKQMKVAVEINANGMADLFGYSILNASFKKSDINPMKF